MTTVTGRQEDMVLVPRNPTPEMLRGAQYEALAEDALGVWRVMIGVYEGTFTEEGIPVKKD